MHEDDYGVIHRSDEGDPEDGHDASELVVDEFEGVEEPEAPEEAEPVLDEPAVIRYTRGPNGKLIQSS